MIFSGRRIRISSARKRRSLYRSGRFHPRRLGKPTPKKAIATRRSAIAAPSCSAPAPAPPAPTASPPLEYVIEAKPRTEPKVLVLGSPQRECATKKLPPTPSYFKRECKKIKTTPTKVGVVLSCAGDGC